jgi:stage V sporulation protein S
MNDSSVIRIGQNTKVSTLATRILDQVRKSGYVTLETVGPGAVNQAVKAVARARQTAELEGSSLVIVPQLVEIPMGCTSPLSTSRKTPTGYRR